MGQKSPPVIHISTFYMILSNLMSLWWLSGLAERSGPGWLLIIVLVAVGFCPTRGDSPGHSRWAEQAEQAEQAAQQNLLGLQRALLSLLATLGAASSTSPPPPLPSRATQQSRGSWGRILCWICRCWNTGDLSLITLWPKLKMSSIISKYLYHKLIPSQSYRLQLNCLHKTPYGIIITS